MCKHTGKSEAAADLSFYLPIDKSRQEAGLPVSIEDTIEVTRTMRAASPPASAADLLEAQNQKPGHAARPFRRVSECFLMIASYIIAINSSGNFLFRV